VHLERELVPTSSSHVDSKGTVAQCDCWVTSYPSLFSAMSFRDPDLTQMLRHQPARLSFVDGQSTSSNTRTASMPLPFHLPRRLPVRTYSALGTMLAKDPYCEVYKAGFGRAETHSRALLRRQLLAGMKRPAPKQAPARLTTVATP
jgi:hypothetical protein